MGHVEIAHVSHALPDGRALFDDVSFRVGDGTVAALVGPNGAGKTTLLRLVAGDIEAQDGTVSRSGGLGVMRQFIGSSATTRASSDLLSRRRRRRVRAAGADLDAAELAMMETDDEPTQLRYAQALTDWGDAGGYDAEVLWDACCVAALGTSYDAARCRVPSHAVRRRAEAAGARDAVPRRRRGAAARRARQLPRRSRQALARGAAPRDHEDGPAGQPRPGTAGRRPPNASSPSRSGTRLGARRRVRDLRPGAARPERPPRGAAPPLGRGARQAQGRWCDAQAEGEVQRRHGLAAAGRPDPAAQVRGGGPAARSRPATRT